MRRVVFFSFSSEAPIYFGASAKNLEWAIDVSVLHALWLLDNGYLAHEVQEILNVSQLLIKQLG